MAFFELINQLLRIDHLFYHSLFRTVQIKISLMTQIVILYEEVVIQKLWKYLVCQLKQ